MSDVVRLLRPKQAEELIRALALSSTNLVVTRHAAERMQERGFATADLVRVLTTGFVVDMPVHSATDDWTCKIVRRLHGSREAGVVTIIVRRRMLIVKTMEWEDIR